MDQDLERQGEGSVLGWVVPGERDNLGFPAQNGSWSPISSSSFCDYPEKSVGCKDKWSTSNQPRPNSQRYQLPSTGAPYLPTGFAFLMHITVRPADRSRSPGTSDRRAGHGQHANGQASALGTPVQETCQPPCPPPTAARCLPPTRTRLQTSPHVQQHQSRDIPSVCRVAPTDRGPTLQTHGLPQRNFPPRVPKGSALPSPHRDPAMPFARTCFWSLCRPFSFCSRRRAARSHCWAKCRILFFMKLRDSFPVPISSRR